MGRSGTGKYDKAASFRRDHRSSVKRPRCPDCSAGPYDYHERGCAWALANDPGMIKQLGINDLVGRNLTVVSADDDSFRFTVDGAPGELYEAGQHEFDDYFEGGVETYTRFEFSRIEPVRRLPSPELPLLPVE